MLKLSFPYKLLKIHVRKSIASVLQPFQKGHVIWLNVLPSKLVGPVYLIFLQVLGVLLDDVPLNVSQDMV